MLKHHPHTPAHLFLNNTTYFITGAIHKKRPLLKHPDIKNDLLDKIRNSFKKMQWQLRHWVILDNHYHLLVKSYEGKDLSHIIKLIHGGSSMFIRQKTGCELPVWWNYWDYCPRTERQYVTCMNYLFINPFKHGYVTNLNDYPFSSFHQQIAKQGRMKLRQQFRDFPNYQEIDDVYDDF